MFNRSIIQSLRLLKSLKTLSLHYNSLEGSFPAKELSVFEDLEMLDLSKNELNGSLIVQGLCGLKKHEELDLSWNSFEGSLPSCLYNLTSLRRLFANHSKLESFQFRCDNEKVEIEIENSDWVPLFKLESLVISNCSLNKLSHQLLTFLIHQHSLRKLDLSHNGLKGPFPDWLFRNNTRLKSTIVNHNSFTGHFHLSLCLNSTSVIDVSNNQLNGKLQRNIGEILPNIWYLQLSNNSFIGSLPSLFGNMSLLDTLDVSLNNFSGEVPKDLFVGCYGLSILFSGAMPNELPNFVDLDLLDIDSSEQPTNKSFGTSLEKLLRDTSSVSKRLTLPNEDGREPVKELLDYCRYRIFGRISPIFC
ncbi:receptor-like protein 15 [Quercus suber]|uniref:Receptor-like protein 15 n=1 Tax=Quercus suber TaxID=58331 RepID=A0AAW0KVA6_QUESU